MKMRILAFVLSLVGVVSLTACKQETTLDDGGMESVEEAAVNDGVNEVEVNTIETKYFEMQTPDFWAGKYTAEEVLSETGMTVYVNMITQRSEYGALIFYIDMIPVEDRESIALSMEFGEQPIGLLETETSEKYALVLGWSSEQACADAEVEFFSKMTDSVDQIIETIVPTDNNIILDWDDSILESDNVPYVPVRFDVLDMSFEGYQNQSGEMFLKLSGQDALLPYHLKMTDNVQYCWGGDETVVGINYDGICLYECWAEDIVRGEFLTTPTVRDVIKEIGIYELFEVTPTFLDLERSCYFIYWKVENGYVGFVTMQGNDPVYSYDYVVSNYVVLEDLDMLALAAA